MPMIVRILLIVVIAASLIAGIVLTLRWLFLLWRTQQRWYELTERERKPGVGAAQGDRRSSMQMRGWLGHWLYRAGFRDRRAGPVFLVAVGISMAMGWGVALGFILSGLQTVMEQNVVLVPGGVGETFLPVVWLAPWLLLLMLAAAPWLVVRRARQERIELVEQDLPLALELLSTLSEAGLGFDTALTRILKTRLAGRPLAEDLRMFQADLLAGRGRTESLRRLSDRLDIPSVSIFVSSLVQAEQMGMGISRVLRQQADDVRARRRERAIAFANALPVKRVIPLVVCFLPGLFVWTLGPAFVELFKMVDAFIQVRNL
jgi:tight adherence protein C